jgi:hypothetical protein
MGCDDPRAGRFGQVLDGEAAGKSVREGTFDDSQDGNGSLDLRARRRDDRSMKISYLWPFRDYRNACTGSALERAAALRHNKTLARQLPAYLNRWSAISCLLLTATEVCPAALAPAVGVAFTIAFVMTVHIAHVWLLFIRS